MNQPVLNSKDITSVAELPPQVEQSSNVVIRVKNLGKCYHIYDRPQDRLMQSFLWGRKKLYRDFWALKDVSFNVEKGETVGIIGFNGSGKSTLLQLICETLTPTTGETEVNGRVGALLELGAGFNPEFTGRENIYLNGALMGFAREDMDKLFPLVEEFAEIGKFIDQPVKTYSSGMFVRLAFACTVSIDPDILLIDEALSVGDMYFQHRCIDRMEALQASGKTVLIVSHDINLIRNFCSRVIFLNEGCIYAQGDAEYVTEQYFYVIRHMQTQNAKESFHVLQKNYRQGIETNVSFGTSSGSILEVHILDKEFERTNTFKSGETIIIQIRARMSSLLKNPSISFTLRDHKGYPIYGTSTAEQNVQLNLNDQEETEVFYSLSPLLASGTYSLAVRLLDCKSRQVNLLIDKVGGIGVFTIIEDNQQYHGCINLNAKVIHKTKYE